MRSSGSTKKEKRRSETQQWMDHIHPPDKQKKGPRTSKNRSQRPETAKKAPRNRRSPALKVVAPSPSLQAHQSNLKGIARGAMAAARWEPATEDSFESYLRVHAYQLIHQLAIPPDIATVILSLWNDCNDLQVAPAVISDQVSSTSANNAAPPELIDPHSAHGRQMPQPLSSYGTTLDVDWIWEGYFAKGYITQLVGTTTIGKTTLIAWILQGMGKESPPSIGTAVHKGRALVLTEEDGKIWKRRAAEIGGIDDHVEFLHHSSIFSGRPSPQEWQDFCCWVAALVELRRYDLVIIDPWQTFNPVADENDSLSNVTAVNHLKLIAAEGAAVVLSHHPSKSVTDYMTAGRGTSATAGLADILMLIKRSGKNQFTTRRQITANGRIGGTPPSMILNLTENGYEVVDDSMMQPLFGSGNPRKSDRSRDITREARLDLITTIIKAAGRPLSPMEILSQWPTAEAESDSKLRPSKRTLYGDLGIHSGLQRTTGKSLRSPVTYNILEVDDSSSDDRSLQDVVCNGVSRPSQRPDLEQPAIPGSKTGFVKAGKEKVKSHA